MEARFIQFCKVSPFLFFLIPPFIFLSTIFRNFQCGPFFILFYFMGFGKFIMLMPWIEVADFFFLNILEKITA